RRILHLLSQRMSPEPIFAVSASFAASSVEQKLETTTVAPVAESATNLIHSKDAVTLREFAGRSAPIRSERQSVALFVLPSGAATPVSYNTEGEKLILVRRGRGNVRVGDKTWPVNAGDIASFPAGQPHRVAADAGKTLKFYAISSPAFGPATYREVLPAPK
ncbi:cupin domain-containing protein, partial [Acetobacter sp. DsW_063]|uniref:cupin domain-containing protein n=1 Tax=Acetobacter sp. DsW_063 TaxID=1514894 RepID=UPI000A389701